MSITREEIRQLCIAHDRFMAEQASEPIRRPPVSAPDDAGLIYKQHDNSEPAPALAADTTLSGEALAQWHADWDRWMLGHLAVERRGLLDALERDLVEILAKQEQDIRQERDAELLKRDRRIGELEGEIRELKGFVGGLLAAFGQKEKTADVVDLPHGFWRRNRDVA